MTLEPSGCVVGGWGVPQALQTGKEQLKGRHALALHVTNTREVQCVVKVNPSR